MVQTSLCHLFIFLFFFVFFLSLHSKLACDLDIEVKVTKISVQSVSLSRCKQDLLCKTSENLSTGLCDKGKFKALGPTWFKKISG